MYYYPLGRVSLINLERAKVIRSGLIHFNTNNFLKGYGHVLWAGGIPEESAGEAVNGGEDTW